MISSVGSSCPQDGDYTEVPADDGGYLCGRMNVELGAACSMESPASTTRLSSSVRAVWMSPTCGIDGFGSGGTSPSVPRRQPRRCNAVPGL